MRPDDSPELLRRGGSGTHAWARQASGRAPGVAEAAAVTHAGAVATRRSQKGFLPTSLRMISSYLKTVSLNADSLVSTVRSATASVASAIATVPDERQQREKVTCASFATLQLSPVPSCPRTVLLLGYTTGFQVWDVSAASSVREIISRRDTAVAALHLMPLPLSLPPPDSPLRSAHPLLCVVSPSASDELDAAGSWPIGSGDFGPSGDRHMETGLPGFEGALSPLSPPPRSSTVLRFYSMQSRSFVTDLSFGSAVVAVRSSSRLFAVALRSQIFCYEAATLQKTYSVLTYEYPGTLPAISSGAFDLGPRWLAFAADQVPTPSTTGRVSPQHLTSSPGASLSTSPAGRGGELMAQFARESGKQLAAGLVVLGDVGYRTVSKYWADFMAEGGGGSPWADGRHTGSASQSPHSESSSCAAGDSPMSGRGAHSSGSMSVSSGHRYGPSAAARPYPGGSRYAVGSPGAVSQSESWPGSSAASSMEQHHRHSWGAVAATQPGSPEADYAGTVMIVDVVTKSVIAHFRAHTSPLAVLAFDPSGTLLATASICGHTISVFRLLPSPSPALLGSKVTDSNFSHVLLYKLHRGLTSAIIQSVVYSLDSKWLAATTTRGTTHIFAMCPFGGPVGPTSHLSDPSLSASTTTPSSPTPFHAHSPALVHPVSHPLRPWWTQLGQPLYSTPSSAAPGAPSSSPWYTRQFSPGPPAPVTATPLARIRSGSGAAASTSSSSGSSSGGGTSVGSSISSAVGAVYHGATSYGAGVLGAGTEAGAPARDLAVMCPVAVHFHFGGPSTHTQGCGTGSYSDGSADPGRQLWVYTSAGYLVRYCLTPYVCGGAANAQEQEAAGSAAPGGGMGYAHGRPLPARQSSVPGAGFLSGMLERLPSAGPGLGVNLGVSPEMLKVGVEAWERWDLIRRLSWAERDQRIEVEAREGTQSGAWGASKKRGSESSLDPESLRRVFLSFAEVGLNRRCSVPIWARPHVQFHVLLPQPSSPPQSAAGSMHLEDLPTRPVDLRRQDLVPVSNPGRQRLLHPHLMPASTTAPTSQTGLPQEQQPGLQPQLQMHAPEQQQEQHPQWLSQAQHTLAEYHQQQQQGHQQQQAFQQHYQQQQQQQGAYQPLAGQHALLNMPTVSSEQPGAPLGVPSGTPLVPPGIQGGSGLYPQIPGSYTRRSNAAGSAVADMHGYSAFFASQAVPGGSSLGLAADGLLARGLSAPDWSTAKPDPDQPAAPGFIRSQTVPVSRQLAPRGSAAFDESEASEDSSASVGSGTFQGSVVSVGSDPAEARLAGSSVGSAVSVGSLGGSGTLPLLGPSAQHDAPSSVAPGWLPPPQKLGARYEPDLDGRIAPVTQGAARLSTQQQLQQQQQQQQQAEAEEETGKAALCGSFKQFSSVSSAGDNHGEDILSPTTTGTTPCSSFDSPAPIHRLPLVGSHSPFSYPPQPRPLLVSPSDDTFRLQQDSALAPGESPISFSHLPVRTQLALSSVAHHSHTAAPQQSVALATVGGSACHVDCNASPMHFAGFTSRAGFAAASMEEHMGASGAAAGRDCGGVTSAGHDLAAENPALKESPARGNLAAAASLHGGASLATPEAAGAVEECAGLGLARASGVEEAASCWVGEEAAEEWGAAAGEAGGRLPEVAGASPCEECVGVPGCVESPCASIWAPPNGTLPRAGSSNALGALSLQLMGSSLRPSCKDIPVSASASAADMTCATFAVPDSSTGAPEAAPSADASSDVISATGPPLSFALGEGSTGGSEASGPLHTAPSEVGSAVGSTAVGHQTTASDEGSLEMSADSAAAPNGFPVAEAGDSIVPTGRSASGEERSGLPDEGQGQGPNVQKDTQIPQETAPASAHSSEEGALAGEGGFSAPASKPPTGGDGDSDALPATPVCGEGGSSVQEHARSTSQWVDCDEPTLGPPCSLGESEHAEGVPGVEAGGCASMLGLEAGREEKELLEAPQASSRHADGVLEDGSEQGVEAGREENAPQLEPESKGRAGRQEQGLASGPRQEQNLASGPRQEPGMLEGLFSQNPLDGWEVDMGFF